MQQPFVILNKLLPGVGTKIDTVTKGLFGLQTVIWSIQGVVNFIPNMIVLIGSVGKQLTWAYDNWLSNTAAIKKYIETAK